MDPIEAAIQARLAEIQGQDNFANYRPSNSLEPVGIAPLIEEGRNDTMSFSNDGSIPVPNKSGIIDMAKNVAKNQAIEYVGKKMGLSAAQSSGIAGLIGLGSNYFAPLAVASALSGRSLGISDYLSNKRAEKAIMKDINRDKQGDITTVNLQNKGSPNPYSGGIGGVQSGMASQGQKDAGPGFSGSGSAEEMGSF